MRKIIILITIISISIVSCSSDNEELKLQNGNSLLSFVYEVKNNDFLDEDIVGEISVERKLVFIEVPYLTDLRLLVPSIKVSEKATAQFQGFPSTFFNTLKYDVTSENGIEVEYEVIITTNKDIQREVLNSIINSNPNNTLNWDLEVDNLKDLNGVSINQGGIITGLFFNNKGIETLPSVIEELKALEYITIQNTPLTSLPSEIKNLENLTDFSLVTCGLTSIPPEVFQLKNLTSLSLENNQIEELPDPLFNLSKLEELRLSSNNINVIQKKISQLSKLTFLKFSSNSISEIPTELAELTLLTNLDFDSNNITNIPVEIAQLSNLIHLDFNNNNISSVPEELGQLTKLNNITLYRNTNLTSIPKAVCDLESLYGTYVWVDEGVICGE